MYSKVVCRPCRIYVYVPYFAGCRFRVSANGAEICEVTKNLSVAKEFFGISANLLLYAVPKRSVGTATTRGVISAPLHRSTVAKRRYCGATL